jgi:hypothetical protein
MRVTLRGMHFFDPKSTLIIRGSFSRLLCLLVALGLVFGLWTNPIWADASAPFVKFRVPNDRGHGEKFLAGFYIYPYYVQQVAERQGQNYTAFLDAWMRRLTAKGFSLFYVTASPNFDDWIRLSEKYNFKMIVQLDFAYLTTPNLDDVRNKAPAAIRFIKTYKDHPNVLAFNVKEEPSKDFMWTLDEYFRKIRAEVPEAPLHLLQNNRDALRCSFKTPITVAATDRYAFWGWDSSAGGYCATPSSALDWFRKDMEVYARYALDRGALFQAVFTTVANIHVTTDDVIRSGEYGNYGRILQLALDENQGWSKLAGKRFKYVKYYRPPANTTRAMVWLSVLNGAQSVLHWSGSPTDPIQETIFTKELYKSQPANLMGEPPGTAADLARDDFEIQMFGPGNAGTPMLDEYAEAVADLQNYGWFINRMRPSADQSKAVVSDENAHARLFDLPGYSGKILVIVNTDVGKWGTNSVRSLVERNDRFRIDLMGNVIGYTPQRTPRTLTVRSSLPGKLFDAGTGRFLGPAGEGKVNIAPGGGAFAYLGDETEWSKLREISGAAALSMPSLPN